MNNVYIKHTGIKGMKWGVRRRSSQSGGDSNGGGSTQKAAKTADDYKSMKKNIDSTASVVDSTKKTTATINKKRNEKIIKEDVTKMSDKDLQKVVNRLNMEERYTQVMSSRAANDGKSRTEKILDNAGTALTVGSSVLSIMIAMKELKK